MKRRFVARSPAQLLAIASPGRDALIDAVESIGPCSIAELARFLGRSRNGLYYHVRALRDCGLLVESHSDRDGKRSTACYEVPVPGRHLRVYFDLATHQARRAVLRLAVARLRSAERSLRRALKPGIAVVEGSRRNVWASSATGWLSTAELSEIGRIFETAADRLRRETGHPRERRKHYRFTFALAPTVPQPPPTTHSKPPRPLISGRRAAYRKSIQHRGRERAIDLLE